MYRLMQELCNLVVLNLLKKFSFTPDFPDRLYSPPGLLSFGYLV